MKTFYTVHRVVKGGEQFDTEEEALADACRRQAADKDNRYTVMRAIRATVIPVPEIASELLKD